MSTVPDPDTYPGVFITVKGTIFIPSTGAQGFLEPSGALIRDETGALGATVWREMAAWWQGLGCTVNRLEITTPSAAPCVYCEELIQPDDPECYPYGNHHVTHGACYDAFKAARYGEKRPETYAEALQLDKEHDARVSRLTPGRESRYTGPPKPRKSKARKARATSADLI